MNQDNNFNLQDNNGIPNNQPLQNNETSKQTNNTNIYHKPLNNKPPKKSKLGLIIGGGAAAVAAIAAGVMLNFGKNNNTGNNNEEGNNNEQLEEAPSDYISIKTVEDYEKLLNGTYDLSKNYILMNDLDLKDYCTNNVCKPIGLEKGFSGIFNGNNYTISNYSFNVNDDDMKNIGFFSNINMGVVKNLKLDNAEIIITNTVNIGTPIGLLSGIARNALIENCSVNGKITTNETISDQINSVGLLVGGVGLVDGLNNKIKDKTITNAGNIDYHIIASIKNTTATGTIELSSSDTCTNIGGLIGSSGAGYHNLYGYSIFNSIENSSANVNINLSSNGSYVGGLIGNSDSDYIYQSYSEGNITARNLNTVAGFIGTSDSSMIEQCYSTTNVTAGLLAAGFISQFNIGIGAEQMYVSNSYSTGTVTIDTDSKYAIPDQEWDTCNCASFIYELGDSIKNSYSTSNIIYANSSVTHGKTFIKEENRHRTTSVYYNGDIINSANEDYEYVKLNSSTILNQSSYKGFNFEKIWKIDEGSSTPYFKWQK